MKKVFSIIFLLCGLMSCQINKDKNNVELTDFTKELISLYINDAYNIDAKKRKDEIIVTVAKDTSYYYLYVFANNCKEHKFCREDFIGQTSHSGHLVRVFGEENKMFYYVKKKIKKQKRCKYNHFTTYDPYVWDVAFFKDESFCKMKTYKGAASEDISDIQDLAAKYFKVSETIKDEVYEGWVENEPQFVLGEDALRRIISSNFKIHKEGNFGKIPIVVLLVVDENGKATLKEVVKSSNDIELDNEAVRVAELICQYDFIPATHRGETVKAIYSILFLRSDITP